MEKVAKVAIYARVSTADKQQSTEMQVSELTQYANARGFKIYKVYEDTGYSGTNGNRPMLRQLMQDVVPRPKTRPFQAGRVPERRRDG